MSKKPKPPPSDDEDPIPEEINDIIRRALKSPPKPRKAAPNAKRAKKKK